jgi:hypothetical protein
MNAKLGDSTYTPVMGFLLETGFLEETNITFKLLDVEIAAL